MKRVVVGLIALLTFAGCADAGAPSAVPSDGATGPGVPYVCIGLEDAHCLAVLDAARTELAPEDVLVYAEIGPFSCQVEPPCPNTLDARPLGVANLERANGDTVNFGITARPDGTIEAMVDDFPEVSVAPSSMAGQLKGEPIPFSLGHCGMWSGIDVDGSWWDPIGFVDGDDPAFVNSTDGMFTPHDTNHATFKANTGLELTLVRRVGDKHLPMCM